MQEAARLWRVSFSQGKEVGEVWGCEQGGAEGWGGGNDSIPVIHVLNEVELGFC